jgi:hypothetical protein
MKTIYGLSAGMLIILALGSLNCAQLKIKEDTLFSKDDHETMAATAGELSYGYSFDNRVGVYNIYATRASESDIPKKKKKFEETAGNIDIKKLESLFYKLIRVRDMIAYRIDIYKKKKEWSGYTYLRKYVSRPMKVRLDGGRQTVDAARNNSTGDITPFEKYLDMLENHINGRDSEFPEKLKGEELKSIAWVKWYLKYQIEPVDLF